MRELIKQTYRRHKHDVYIGPVLRFLRNLLKIPYLERRRLLRRDVNAVDDVISSRYGKDSVGHSHVKAFRDSDGFKKKFSHGHSGDFDVMMLYILVRMERPQVVVETGVASGRSSTAILQALYENKKGTLYSIDLPKFYDGMEPGAFGVEGGKSELAGFIPEGHGPGWLIPEHLKERWKLILGNSKTELPKLLEKLGTADIFYHDSDHSYASMMFEFKTVWPFIREGGYLLSDDMTWNSAWEEFTADKMSKFHHVYRNFGILQK